MRFLAPPLVLAVFLVMPAVAEDAVPFADYRENSGSLPPEYAGDLTVRIMADGALRLTYCRGYRTEAPSCAGVEGRLSATDIDAIRAAAVASGLAGRPAERLSDSEIPVGGGSRSGRVLLDGTAIDLPAFPREPDAARVAAVLDAIAATIPRELVARAESDAGAP